MHVLKTNSSTINSISNYCKNTVKNECIKFEYKTKINKNKEVGLC